MNTKKRLLRLSLWILVATLLSCAQATNEVIPRSTFTPIVRVSGTPAATVATEIAPTSSTATDIPTLPPDEASQRFLDLLSNNGGCTLPCIWGITPGQSTDPEAQNILAPLASISEITVFKPSLGSLSPVYAEGDRWLTANIRYLADQRVNRIALRIEELEKTISTDGGAGFDPVYDSSLFGERANSYMLHTILTSHGRPESVMLGTTADIPPREPPGGFHILLLYPDQGILIEYTTQMHKTGTNISGCPANAHVELELYASGNADAFYSSLEKLDSWSVKQNWYRSLEDTTSMSVEEFYETFREPTDMCINTLASLWPKPEP